MSELRHPNPEPFIPNDRMSQILKEVFYKKAYYHLFSGFMCSREGNLFYMEKVCMKPDYPFYLSLDLSLAHPDLALTNHLIGLVHLMGETYEQHLLSGQPDQLLPMNFDKPPYYFVEGYCLASLMPEFLQMLLVLIKELALYEKATTANPEDNL
ncbi:hypothetical protein A4G20_03625 [Pasteurellaceae bacterium RH1A]|nr:hypothetical protein A4G20_03625 [Pasteurellaceae bacterium RH1A]